MALVIKMKPKHPFYPKLNLELAFNDLIDLISAKRRLYIKPGDLVRVFGIDDHYRVTMLGVLLSTLAKISLAKRHNGCRPIRYTLKPEWVWKAFMRHCGRLPPGRRFCCVTDGSVCGLAGVCPYWRVKEVLGGG